MLGRIVYVSTLEPHVTDAEIDDLVEKAAVFNKAHGITGLLAFEGRRVCQILEGPEEAIGALYRSIDRDSRHRGVTEILNEPIAATTFENWGMVRRPMIDMVMAAYTLK